MFGIAVWIRLGEGWAFVVFDGNRCYKMGGQIHGDYVVDIGYLMRYWV
jgi:hypothetical protein